MNVSENNVFFYLLKRNLTYNILYYYVETVSAKTMRSRIPIKYIFISFIEV